MRVSHIPPSKNHQKWGLIAFIIITFTTISYVALFHLGWEIFISYGSLEEHVRFIFKDILNNGSIDQYLTIIEEKNMSQELYFQLIGYLILALLLPVFFTIKYVYVKGGRTLEVQTKGVRLIENNEVKTHAYKQLKKEAYKPSDLGLFLHPDIQIPRKRELNNILVTGMQGAGKSAFILTILEQLIKSKVRLFIYDEKREYSAKIYYESKDYLIAPWDKRGVQWDIAKDIQNAGSAYSFAKRVITETSDPIWGESASQIFAGIIVALQKKGEPWSWPDLYEYTLYDKNELLVLFQNYYPSAAKLIDSGSPTTASILINMQSNLGWLKGLSEFWGNSNSRKFSIKNWVMKPSLSGSIIVQGHKKFKAIGAPLFSAMFSVLSDEYLANDKKPKQNTWLVLDEFAAITKSDVISEWMSTARESGGHTIIGIQAISQIIDIYGKERADSIFAMCGNVVTLRLGSLGGDSQYVSQGLGEKIIERPTYQQDKDGRSTFSWQKETVPTVLASEIVHLPMPSNKTFFGYLTINGWNATYKLNWPFSNLIDRCSRTVPSQTTAKKKDQSEKVSNRPARIKRRRNHKS